MKTAVFCSKPVDPFVVFALLPDNVETVISAVGFDFCARDVARMFKCPCMICNTTDEAISEADFVYVIWDGSDSRVLDISKRAKAQGKNTMFSYMP